MTVFLDTVGLLADSARAHGIEPTLAGEGLFPSRGNEAFEREASLGLEKFQ